MEEKFSFALGGGGDGMLLLRPVAIGDHPVSVVIFRVIQIVVDVTILRVRIGIRMSLTSDDRCLVSW